MATEVVIPMLGVTVEKGKIVEWLKREGEPVRKGESIFVVEVDKATTEVEAPASGILAKILLPVGEEVPVLSVVGVITEPGEAVPEPYLEGTPAVQRPEAEAAPKAAEPPQAAATRERRREGPVKIVPAARRLAREKGIDIETLEGTGPGGVVLVSDVERAASREATAVPRVSTLAAREARKAGISLDDLEGTGVRGRIMRGDVREAVRERRRPGLGKVLPFDGMRKVIARRMSQSAFTAPHIHFFTDVRMDPLLDLRKSVQAHFQAHEGIKPSVNDFLIKAVALNIAEFPLFNATLEGEEIHIPPQINVGLAVALESGLIVPAVEDADLLGLAAIARRRDDLVRRARAGKLRIEETERGTFTISSLAGFDIHSFTAVINPPQSAILSVGKTRDEVFLREGEVAGRRVATFGLAVDHRVIDGAAAAAFLQKLKEKLEHPAYTFLDR